MSRWWRVVGDFATPLFVNVLAVNVDVELDVLGLKLLYPRPFVAFVARFLSSNKVTTKILENKRKR